MSTPKKKALGSLAAQLKKLEQLMLELGNARQTLTHFRMMDDPGWDEPSNKLTESLKQLHQGFMESDYPQALGKSELGIINNHFWMVYETAEYVDSLESPDSKKDDMLLCMDTLINTFSNISGKEEQNG